MRNTHICESPKFRDRHRTPGGPGTFSSQMYVAQSRGSATSCATLPYIGFPFACSPDPRYAIAGLRYRSCNALVAGRSTNR